MKNLTVYISYVEDTRYLKHCLSIINNIEFFNDIKINLDGWKTHGVSELEKNPKIDSMTSHSEWHGTRLFNLLKEASTEKIMVFDSDFFCSDPLFWENACKMSDSFPLVSVGRKWYFNTEMPSTPFLILTKDLLEILPEPLLWNHFGRFYPEVPYPIFDNMQYLFLICMIKKLFGCVDSWYPLERRKYKIYHLWGSLASTDSDFDKYKSKGNKLYLVRYICKSIFFFCLGESELPKEIWQYINIIQELKPHPIFFDLLDIVYNLEYQVQAIEAKNRLITFKDEFYKRYPSFRIN